MEHETAHLLSRRQVLRGAAGLGLAAAATGTVLSACGSDDGDKQSASPPSTTPTPTPAKPAPQRSINVGDIRITYLPDGEGHVAKKVFPNSPDAGWQLHSRWLGDDGRVVTSFGGYLIETGDRKVLVDLGFGAKSFEVPDFAKLQGGKYLDSLKQTGVAPGDVDTVVYTHLHLDHVGWTTSGGNLTFPNARYITGEAEWRHWQQPDQTGNGPDPETVLKPLSTRIEHPADGAAIAPGVNVMSTPGHTPGHHCFVVSSGANRAIILGDMVWCPLQLQEQEWDLAFDVDPAMARRARTALMKELEGTSTIAAGSHFAEAVFGRILPGAGKQLWQAV